MPLILPEELEDKWLVPATDELDIESLKELIQTYPEEELTAYTVGRLRGTEYLDNVASISKKVDYSELVF